MILPNSGSLCKLGISSIITQILRSGFASNPKIAFEAMANHIEISGLSEACCWALLDKNKKPFCLSSCTQSCIENSGRNSCPASFLSSNPSKNRSALIYVASTDLMEIAVFSILSDTSADASVPFKKAPSVSSSEVSITCSNLAVVDSLSSFII